MMLSEETSRQGVFAVTGGNFSGYYRFKKGFYGLADIPTIFQEKNRQNIRILYTCVVRRYNSGHTRRPRRPQKETIRCTEKTGRRRIQSERKKI